jgi:hypothetical protein
MIVVIIATRKITGVAASTTAPGIGAVAVAAVVAAAVAAVVGVIAAGGMVTSTRGSKTGAVRYTASILCREVRPSGCFQTIMKTSVPFLRAVGEQ